MRYLNLSVNDFANMAHENANALRSVGVHCEDYCLVEHTFQYKSCSKKTEARLILNIAKRFDIIQIFHTSDAILRIVERLGKKIIIYHTGTIYRQDPEKYNHIFYGYTQLTDQTEFIRLGNMRYVAPHISHVATRKRAVGKLIVGHFPSNPDVKGTKQIEEMLHPFRRGFELRIDSTKVSHDEQIKRMSECHVYVELFAPKQSGKPYGCFGVTAFEAASLGCLVVTNNLFPKVYEREYGTCYFHIANDKQNFTRAFNELIDVDRKMLTTPAGFYINHNIESAGYKILQLTR